MREQKPASKAGEPRAGALGIVAVVLLIADMLLIVLQQYASGPLLIPELVGALLTPVIFALLVIGIARLFRRARGPRGAAAAAIWTLAVIGLGALGGVVTAIKSPGAAAGQTAAQLASASAADVSKTLPKQVDSVTELRSVAAAGDTLVYEYRLSNTTAADLDSAAVEAFRGQLIDHACANQSMRDRFMRHGVVIRHQYADTSGARLTSVDVTDAICTRGR